MTTPQVVLTRLPRTLVWQVPPGWVALSSAAVGGGLSAPRWVANIEVGADFRRTDLDVFVGEVAARRRLAGPGTALLTAADVAQVEHATSGGVQVWATVGVTRPTWPVGGAVGAAEAAAPMSDRSPAPGHRRRHQRRHLQRQGDQGRPGTVNLVVAVPVPLTPSALVQAVGTVTEAKAQVLVQAGVPGTGTASDAMVVLCPGPRVGSEDRPASPTAPTAFAGVRSPWGQHLAGAAHAAVAAGLAANPWPAADVDPTVVW